MNDTDLQMILSFKDAEIERQKQVIDSQRSEIISLNKMLAMTLLKLDMANNELRQPEPIKVPATQIKMKI